MEKENTKIQSPCTKVCKIDINLGLCTGCYRTLNEIAAWAAMTDEERTQILKRIKIRRT